MGFFNKLSRLFDSHVETSERHPEETLQTHYYKTSKDKMMQALEELIAARQDFSLLDISKERGEMSVNVTGRKKGFLVITIVSVRPFRTSVDFSFTIERGLNLGYGQKLVRDLYERLNQKMPFVGYGMAD
ncbi:cytosolic protein [Camelliibacillus cellulosilyticus]|uniref:Cytosolic protein n=1 Tax=Camelliibacillus cellulosilyticus TaxID=2174486 RepID=A0ABV9GMT2_9BACL